MFYDIYEMWMWAYVTVSFEKTGDFDRKKIYKLHFLYHYKIGDNCLGGRLQTNNVS